MNILVIEDNQSDFLIIKRFAWKLGINAVEWCQSLAQGKAYLMGNQVDVLLVDLSLPDSYGLGIIDELQTQCRTVPIIIFTGYDDDEQGLEAVRRGAQDYLVKGKFTIDMLNRSLRYAIERKKAEQTLALERNLLRTVIDSLPDYIVYKDDQLRFVLTNVAHANAVNSTPDELVGKTANEVFPTEFVEQFHADDKHVIKSGIALINVERETIDESGKIKIVLTSKIPIRDQDDKVKGIIGISRDISERKELEMHMKELFAEQERIRILRQFVTDIAHDFRTPLAIANTSLYLVQNVHDQERQLYHCEKIKSQLARLEQLLEDSLQIIDLHTQELMLDCQITNINKFLKSIIHGFQTICDAQGILITFHPCPTTSTAWIDPIKFSLALTNLLENAITYNCEDGIVDVIVSTHNSQISIAIRDSGIGIDSRSLPHIFEMFYREDDARSTSTGRHGLGLPITKRIIESHNGTINVTSEKDIGSTFTVTIPQCTQDNAKV